LLHQAIAHLLVFKHCHANVLRDIFLHQVLSDICAEGFGEAEHGHFADVATPLVTLLLSIWIKFPLLGISTDILTSSVKWCCEKESSQR